MGSLERLEYKLKESDNLPRRAERDRRNSLLTLHEKGEKVLGPKDYGATIDFEQTNKHNEIGLIDHGPNNKLG